MKWRVEGLLPFAGAWRRERKFFWFTAFWWMDWLDDSCLFHSLWLVTRHAKGDCQRQNLAEWQLPPLAISILSAGRYWKVFPRCGPVWWCGFGNLGFGDWTLETRDSILKPQLQPSNLFHQTQETRLDQKYFVFRFCSCRAGPGLTIQNRRLL